MVTFVKVKVKAWVIILRWVIIPRWVTIPRWVIIPSFLFHSQGRWGTQGKDREQLSNVVEWKVHAGNLWKSTGAVQAPMFSKFCKCTSSPRCTLSSSKLTRILELRCQDQHVRFMPLIWRQLASIQEWFLNKDHMNGKISRKVWSVHTANEPMWKPHPWGFRVGGCRGGGDHQEGGKCGESFSCQGA